MEWKMMGTTMKCDLLFNGIMWSAPGWWKLRPIRPVEEKKKRSYKRGKTWKSLIKATLLTDIVFLNLPFYCQQWENASHDEMFNMTWVNNKFTQWDTMAERTTTENRCEKQGGNTHSFVVTYLICAHTHKTKAAIRLGIQQSVHSAMVTMCACYKGPSVSAFMGRGVVWDV